MPSREQGFSSISAPCTYHSVYLYGLVVIRSAVAAHPPCPSLDFPAPRMSRPAVLLLLVTIFATLLAGCSPLAVLDRLTPDGTYVASLNLAYGAAPSQQLDVYRPAAGAPAQPGGYPVVVFLHGGTWNSGARRDYRFVGEALAARGIVSIVADSRLYPQVRYPDFLTDCAAAMAWAVREAPRYGGGDLRRLRIDDRIKIIRPGKPYPAGQHRGRQALGRKPARIEREHGGVVGAGAVAHQVQAPEVAAVTRRLAHRPGHCRRAVGQKIRIAHLRIQP